MPRLTYPKRAAIRQALAMQELCFSGAQLLDEDLRQTDEKEQRARIATASGNLMRAWTGLAESIRVLKGDPAPGSLRPENKPKGRRLGLAQTISSRSLSFDEQANGSTANALEPEIMPTAPNGNAVNWANADVKS